jgi:hypothetical protein
VAALKLVKSFESLGSFYPQLRGAVYVVGMAETPIGIAQMMTGAMVGSLGVMIVGYYAAMGTVVGFLGTWGATRTRLFSPWLKSSRTIKDPSSGITRIIEKKIRGDYNKFLKNLEFALAGIG